MDRTDQRPGKCSARDSLPDFPPTKKRLSTSKVFSCRGSDLPSDINSPSWLVPAVQDIDPVSCESSAKKNKTNISYVSKDKKKIKEEVEEDDCFISEVEYAMKKDDNTKYILSPNLDYTDSDFEEDSKYVSVEDEDSCLNVHVPPKILSVCDRKSRTDTKQQQFTHSPIPPKGCVEEEQVTSTVDDSAQTRNAKTRKIKHSKSKSEKSGIKTLELPVSGDDCVNSEKNLDVLSPKEALFQHYVIRGGKKLLVCEVCERIFSSRNHLMKHMEIHTGVKVHQCSTCSETFNRKYLLDEHKKVHSIKMEDAAGKLSSISPRYSHRKSQREARVRCGSCSVWLSPRAVDLHASCHLAGKTYICHWCHEGYYNSSALNEHLKSHASKSKTYVYL